MIYYDFNCKRFYKKNGDKKDTAFFDLGKKALSPSKRIQLTVENVNRYIYQVSIKGTNVHYQSDIPPLLNELFLATDSSRLRDGLLDAFGKANDIKSLANSVGVAPEDTCLADEVACRYQIYKRALFVFDTLYSNLKARRLSAYALCGQFPCCEGDSMLVSYTRMIRVLNFAKLKQVELLGVLPNKSSAVELVKYLQESLPQENEITKLYLFIQNIRARNSTYVSPPMYVTGNRFELELKITPWDSIAKHVAQPYDTDSAYYDFAVKWKPFVSFSSGSFVTFDRYMQDAVYDWQPVPGVDGSVADGNRYVLTQSGYTRTPVGFAAFANAEMKVSRVFGFGLSAGAGLTIEKTPSLAYLGGVSLFFGDMQQLALTGGFAGMHVDRLKSHLQPFADNRTVFASAARPNIEYYKEMRVGLFLSVSYTPFKYAKRPIKEEAAKEKQ